VRIEQLIYIGQFVRLVTRHAQLPVDSASMRWLRAAAHGLGNCASVVNQAGPARLTFARRSTIGLSALEMHLLADWLESPQFPRGSYTLLTPAPPEDLGVAGPAPSARLQKAPTTK
jgi:hypothetical protein